MKKNQTNISLNDWATESITNLFSHIVKGVQNKLILCFLAGFMGNTCVSYLGNINNNRIEKLEQSFDDKIKHLIRLSIDQNKMIENQANINRKKQLNFVLFELLVFEYETMNKLRSEYRNDDEQFIEKLILEKQIIENLFSNYSIQYEK